MLRGVKVRGSGWTPDVPRALGFSRAGGFPEYGASAPAKEQGH